MQSAKTRPGADCGSDHELIAKFRLKLKKVGKASRPFRYDLNQIPYDYTVEVTNRFKGLYLIDRVPEELQVEVRWKSKFLSVELKNGFHKHSNTHGLRVKLLPVLQYTHQRHPL